MRTLLLQFLFVGLIATANGDTWELRDLYSFGQRDPQGGSIPADPPILGADGALYGTTTSGGTFSKGVVYRFQPSDSSYLVLRHFLGGADGGRPVGSAFLQANDDRLYGFAVNPRLILYSLATDGSDYRVLFTFPVGAELNGGPLNVPSLTAGPDGLLYGIYMTTGSNGPPVHGTMFRIARDGSAFQILVADMLSPSSPVSFGKKGQLFGTTFNSLYRLEPDGSNFQNIHTFPPPQFGEMQPEGGLVHASNDFIYGATDRGGSFGFGTIFRLREDGSEFQTIYEPNNVNDGGHHRAPPIEGGDGFIYGALGENSFGVESNVWRIAKDGTGFQILKRLPQNGRGTNGVTEALDGFLYGHTTPTNTGRELFRLARDGSTFTLVHQFPSAEGFPLAPIAIVRAADQRIYGLTDKNGTAGRGALFRMNADGSGFMLLRDFGAGAASEQAQLPKAICAGADGAVYGLVRQQGSGGAGVFRYRPNDGSFVWLQTFDSSVLSDNGSILFGSDGLLYGAIDTNSVKTERIFRLDTNGQSFALLRTLSTTSGTAIGTAALTEGPDGLLYGATTRNGTSTVPLLFRMTRDGSVFTPLHDVTAGNTPGTSPPFGLLAAGNGQLYGYASNAIFRCNADGSGFQTTQTFSTGNTFSQRMIEGFDGFIYGALPFGGAPRRGSVFRMAPDGSTFVEVFTFPDEPLRGQAPLGTIITAPDGAFIGLTQSGGDANRGTIFRVATPAQIVGINGETLHFDALHHFTGSVVGPPGRPVDVQHSDDLNNWTLLQRVNAPEINPSFIDPSMTVPSTRFYRAVAP